MNYASWRSLPAMFFEVARQREARTFLWGKRHREYEAVTWSEAAERVMRLAHGLAGLGIERGDRVVLVSENRPEWVIADLAIMSAGAVTVPAYTTNTIDDHRHILRNSGARAAIVSSAVLARRVIDAAAQAPGLAMVIAMEPPEGGSATVRMHSWDDMLAAAGGEIDARVAELGADDLACIIHTSGTGGAPKGVMLSHRNIIANCRGAHRLLQELGLEEERFLSFLPLSHAYEHSAGMMFPISIGAEIYFAQGAETLAHDLLEVRPTMMTAVPRLYETMHQRIRLAMQRERPMKRMLFERTIDIGRKRLAGDRLSLTDHLMDPVLDRLVRDQVRARFGGRLKAMISGGAPLNSEIGGFFVALGVRLLQGYGQSEAAPIICCNPPSLVKIDTVGPAFDGVTIRIAEDGEILVSGDNVMQGYWNDPAETVRTVVDGWLHTGDIGRLDADGYLVITDRKRDFIKNSGGDMISPAHVEGALVMAPEIAQATVFGDQRPYLVAVLVPDQDLVAGWAKQHPESTDPAALAGNPQFQNVLGDAVARVNAGLAIAERVRRFVIAAEPFSVANAQLTPTMKVRRHAVRAAYQAAIEALYDGKSAAA